MLKVYIALNMQKLLIVRLSIMKMIMLFHYIMKQIVQKAIAMKFLVITKSKLTMHTKMEFAKSVTLKSLKMEDSGILLLILLSKETLK